MRFREFGVDGILAAASLLRVRTLIPTSRRCVFVYNDTLLLQIRAYVWPEPTVLTHECELD